MKKEVAVIRSSCYLARTQKGGSILIILKENLFIYLFLTILVKARYVSWIKRKESDFSRKFTTLIYTELLRNACTFELCALCWWLTDSRAKQRLREHKRLFYHRKTWRGAIVNMTVDCQYIPVWDVALCVCELSYCMCAQRPHRCAAKALWWIKTCCRKVFFVRPTHICGSEMRIMLPQNPTWADWTPDVTSFM